MELKEYITPLRKWWWLIFASTLVAMAASFFATTQQPPLYRSRTALVMGQSLSDPNPDGSSVYFASQLLGTYADIAQREPMQKATMDALGLSWLPEYTVRPLPNTPLLEITVTDTSPERAMVVANELANQMIQVSPSGAGASEQERQAFINAQLDDLEAQIEATNVELTAKRQELGELFSARQIADTQGQIDALDGKLGSLQNSYALLLSNSAEDAFNSLSVIEPAVLPTRPSGSGPLATILTAGAIGFVLAAAAAYLLEYLDNSVKTPEDIERALNLPIIGFIGESSIISEYENSLIVTDQPRSPVAESFRALRTNLEFAGVDKPLRSILVTSSGPGEGKTTVSANLAAVMAQGNKRVILVDGDLRKPRVHRQLGLSNRQGLSDIFRGQPDLHGVIRSWKNSFAVITSGSLPPNPSELLGSEKMSRLIEQLGQFADTVIIDSPPTIVTDASLLAAKVDGVVLVVRPGHTQTAAIKSTVEQMERVGARVLGVVLNRIPKRGAFYYAGTEYYYAPYYAKDEPAYQLGGDSGKALPSGGSSRTGRFSGLFNRAGSESVISDEVDS